MAYVKISRGRAIQWPRASLSYLMDETALNGSVFLRLWSEIGSMKADSKKNSFTLQNALGKCARKVL